MSGKRPFSRILLILLSVIGFVCAVDYNHELNGLRETLTRLQRQVGVWEVEDVSKVVIAGIPTPEDAVPPGIETAHVWQYRMHLPADYAPANEQLIGWVRADSPGGQGDHSSGSSVFDPEPQQMLVTMALVKDDGHWFFYSRVGGSSRRTTIPSDFTIDSLDEFIVWPVVEENEIRVFDADDAICLFRLREKVLATDQDGNDNENLYRGLVCYFLKRERRNAFYAWARGERSSMGEFQP